MLKIYLLPGLMTDEKLYSRISPLLEQFELIHIPIPLCEDFDMVCEILDGYFMEEKINLLGFSFGSYIAAYYAIKNPSKINKLFLLAGSASFLNTKEIQRRKLALKQMDSFGFRGLSDKKVLDLIQKKNHNDFELIDIIKKMFSDLGLECYKKQMKLSFKREDISEKLTSLDMPIKLLYSKNDKLFDYSALKRISSKKCKNIKLVEKEGASHFIPLEDAIGLAKEINEWI